MASGIRPPMRRPYGQSPGPVGIDQGQVQGLALDKYREAMMRRMQGGGAAVSASAQPAPANPVNDVLKRRNSRGVLRRMGNPDEHDYR